MSSRRAKKQRARSERAPVRLCFRRFLPARVRDREPQYGYGRLLLDLLADLINHTHGTATAHNSPKPTAAGHSVKFPGAEGADCLMVVRIVIHGQSAP